MNIVSKKFVFILIALLVGFGVGFYAIQLIDSESKVITKSINSFEDCIAAGNPAMESYPRQCITKDGQHFVEEILDYPEAGQDDYDSEGRRYVSHDKGQCMRMLYVCESGEQGFSDSSGCGCAKYVAEPKNEDIFCTQEYDPVCGEIDVQCIKAPCPPVKLTFSNSCFAELGNAKNITKGECKK